MEGAALTEERIGIQFLNNSGLAASSHFLPIQVIKLFRRTSNLSLYTPVHFSDNPNKLQPHLIRIWRVSLYYSRLPFVPPPPASGLILVAGRTIWRPNKTRRSLLYSRRNNKFSIYLYLHIQNSTLSWITLRRICLLGWPIFNYISVYTFVSFKGGLYLYKFLIGQQWMMLRS